MKIIYLFLSFTSVSAFISTIKPKNKPRISKLFPSDEISKITSMQEEWTYLQLNKNIDLIDGITIINKNNELRELYALTKDHLLHKVQFVPQLSENLINLLTEHNIPFDFKMINDITIPFPLQLIGIYLTISIILPLIIRNQNMMPSIKKNEIDTEIIDVTFDDVAGCDEAKFELTEMVDFLKDPKKYQEVGAIIPKGILLEGPPGTGKTLLAKAVAGEAGVPFFYASGSQFIEMFVGVGASRVRELFEKASTKSPCVIFLDEIDAIGRQRGAGLAGGNDEREQTLNQILTNMDGFIKNKEVIVIAATNRADILDKALTRPGRFDRKVVVGLPDKEGRKSILNVHFKNKELSNKVSFDLLSGLLSGFSGADIENLANEAAILSVRYNETQITNKIIMDAFEKITIGLPTKVETRSNSVLKMVSYHEIGHTLVAMMFDELFYIRKVTIQSNKNGAGGYTLFTPKEPYDSFPTKEFFLANIMVSLGGRIAEKILYKKNNKKYNWLNEIEDLDITTGASNDLKQAHSLARKYVMLFGNIGIYDDSDNSMPFLGRDIYSNNKLSEYSKQEIDKQVESIISYCYDKANDILLKYEDRLHSLSNELLNKKTLEPQDLYTI
ncbi:MAG: cell division protein FtsH [Rhodobacteraceae bacterium]|nr:cell division protein FtsH [Paracoccaceae bacterium]